MTPTTPTSGTADLASRLRNACASVRSKSYPLADLIPLMQQAADALASAPAQPITDTNTASGAAELLKALTAATRSLETIQLLAGKEDTLEDMMQVRAYATSRAMVANAAIAAFEDASAQSADECQHGSKYIVHDCMRCGAPVCCGKCCAEDTQPQHEDLAIWKKRALEAEALNHRFITDINGPTFVGEPSTSDDALMAREFYESQEDSLLICASDLQHSAIYDNSAEMQACMRDVADRIAALASTPAQPVAILFEHEDGRYAINPDTTGEPAWHRLGPVELSALSAPAARFDSGALQAAQHAKTVAWPYESPMPDGSVFVGASAERLQIGVGTPPGTIEKPLYLAAPPTAIDSYPPPALEGWTLVPIELTDAMWNAMMDWGTKKSEWLAILDAAPGPADGESNGN